MKLTIEGTPEELREKRELLLKSLVSELQPLDAELAEIIEKAIPSKEPRLKFKVLRQVAAQARKGYQDQLQKMLDDIEAVLNTEQVQGARPKPKPPEALEKTKRTKEAADYQAVATDMASSCAQCDHYRPPECDLVQGNVSPMGWCKLWTPAVQKSIPESLTLDPENARRAQELWQDVQGLEGIHKADDAEAPDPGEEPPDPDYDPESGEPIFDPTTGLTPSETEQDKKDNPEAYADEDEDEEKSLSKARNVTPIGGLTPGGYRVHEVNGKRVYVKEYPEGHDKFAKERAQHDPGDRLQGDLLREALTALGDGLYAAQAAAPMEQDSTGFSGADMDAWHRFARGNVPAMRSMLRKYQRQLLASHPEEFFTTGLADPHDKKAKAEFNWDWNEKKRVLVWEIGGKNIGRDRFMELKRILEDAGFQWNRMRGPDARNELKDPPPDFDFEGLQKKIEDAIGEGVISFPSSYPTIPEPPTAEEREKAIREAAREKARRLKEQWDREEREKKEAIEKIKQEALGSGNSLVDSMWDAMDNHRVTEVVAAKWNKEEGYFEFRFRGPEGEREVRELSKLFSNKRGIISSLTWWPEIEKKGGFTDPSVVRVFDIGTAEQCVELAKGRAPNWQFATEGFEEARAEYDARQAEFAKPIPEVHEALGINPKTGEKFELYPYQNEGVRFLQEALKERKPEDRTPGIIHGLPPRWGGGTPTEKRRLPDKVRTGAILGDEMGLGKTLQALTYAMLENQKTICVVPKQVRRQWINEGEKFFPDHFNGRELDSAALLKIKRKFKKEHGRDATPEELVPLLGLDVANLASINYESLGKFREILEAAGFNFMVVDESHRVKNPAAQVTRHIQKLSGKVDRTLLMSGTALKNEKKDFVTQLEIIRPGEWDKFERENQYNRSTYMVHEVQTLTAGSLWQRMRPFYLSRPKTLVLKDLPDRETQIVEQSLKEQPDLATDVDTFIKNERYFAIAEARENGEPESDMEAIADEAEQAAREYLTELYEDYRNNGLNDGEAKAAVAAAVLKKGIEEYSRIKFALAQAKVPATVDMAKEMLESSDSNIIIFTESKAASRQIVAALGDVAVLHNGDVSTEKREEAKAKFENGKRSLEEEKRVFVSTIPTAREGINLTAADKVIFNDLPWTAADLAQAEARAWRIGQENKVNVYWNVAEGNDMDTLISSIIKRKIELHVKHNAGQQIPEKDREWMEKPVTKADILRELQGMGRGQGITIDDVVGTPEGDRTVKVETPALTQETVPKVTSKEQAKRVMAEAEKRVEEPKDERAALRAKMARINQLLEQDYPHLSDAEAQDLGRQLNDALAGRPGSDIDAAIAAAEAALARKPKAAIPEIEKDAKRWRKMKASEAADHIKALVAAGEMSRALDAFTEWTGLGGWASSRQGSTRHTKLSKLGLSVRGSTVEVAGAAKPEPPATSARATDDHIFVTIGGKEQRIARDWETDYSRRKAVERMLTEAGYKRPDDTALMERVHTQVLQAVTPKAEPKDTGPTVKQTNDKAEPHLDAFPEEIRFAARKLWEKEGKGQLAESAPLKKREADRLRAWFEEHGERNPGAGASFTYSTPGGSVTLAHRDTAKESGWFLTYTSQTEQVWESAPPKTPEKPPAEKKPATIPTEAADTFLQAARAHFTGAKGGVGVGANSEAAKWIRAQGKEIEGGHEYTLPDGGAIRMTTDPGAPRQRTLTYHPAAKKTAEPKRQPATKRQPAPKREPVEPKAETTHAGGTTETPTVPETNAIAAGRIAALPQSIQGVVRNLHGKEKVGKAASVKLTPGEAKRIHDVMVEHGAGGGDRVSWETPAGVLTWSYERLSGNYRLSYSSNVAAVREGPAPDPERAPDKAPKPPTPTAGQGGLSAEAKTPETGPKGEQLTLFKADIAAAVLRSMSESELEAPVGVFGDHPDHDDLGKANWGSEGLSEPLSLEKAGPFIGPRGGKWKDAAHTIPWTEDEPKAGKLQVTVPGAIFGGDTDRTETFHVEDRGDKVKITQHGSHGPTIPKVSLKHFVNDISGKVDLPLSGRDDIDAVISGKAKLLGKGDDGLAFKVGDKVVKVSTTVPFQPMNEGHRTPAEAADMLKEQVATGNMLADKGIPGVQRSEFVKHGDKGFQIKEWVEIPEKLTREQLDKIQATIHQIHDAGYSLRDTVQAGINSKGESVLFDVGKAAPSRGKNDVKDDLDNLRMLYRDSGETFVNQRESAGEKMWTAAEKRRWDLKPKEASPEEIKSVNNAIKLAAKLLRREAEATLSGDELDDRLFQIDMDEKFNTVSLKKSAEFFDYTAAIAEDDGERYTQIQRELIKRGHAKPGDFEQGGPLYGRSTNELISWLESLKANNGGE